MIKLIEELKVIKRGIKLIIDIEKKYAALIVVTAVVATIPNFLSFNTMALIIDELSGNADLTKIVAYVLLTIMGNFIISLMLCGLNHIKKHYNKIFNYKEQLYLSEKMLNMDFGKLEDRVTRLLFEQIKSDNHSGFNTHYLCLFLGDLIKATINILISLSYIIELLIVNDINLLAKGFLLTIIFGTAIAYYFSNRHQGRLEVVLSEKSTLSNAFFYFYDGFYSDYHVGKDIRLCNMEDLAYSEQNKQNIISYNIQMERQNKNLPFGLLTNVTHNILNIVVYIFIVGACVNNNISIGAISKYVNFVLLFVSSINIFSSKLQALFTNNIYLKRYFSFLDIKSEFNSGICSINDNCKHVFEFKNVSFKYPNSKQYALSNINVRIEQGNKTAIVGMNGSGKTTFIKLLCRLYAPTSGQILLDGVDISKYKYDEYINLFSVVFQNFKLYAYPLDENLSCSVNPEADRVVKCLYKVDMNELLQKINNNTHICLYKDFDKNGMEISGGEAQKIALARAVYKEAPLVILDEPTAALDPIAEYKIYSDFNKIVTDNTAIYISHRLSSCRFSDNIIVFDSGKIVQTGTHEQLVSNKEGKYYELWSTQAQYYEQNE